jgi:phosphate starvation-inducible protein PhoH and related proteins
VSLLTEKLEKISLNFDENQHLPILFGPQNKNLILLEQELNVTISSRGGQLSIVGEQNNIEPASLIIQELYSLIKLRGNLHDHDIRSVIRHIPKNASTTEIGFSQPKDVIIETQKRFIRPRSPMQATFIRALQDYDLTFALGPAGTGKTYLAVAKAVNMLINGHVDRIVVSRPVREAGESLGFLPGDIREKVDPYLRPIYDALYDVLPKDQVNSYLDHGQIEIAPLAYMRGRTLSNAFVILDEAQNTTTVQMKMLLTRLGENSRMAITGDLSQIDLPSGIKSGLRDAIDILRHMDGVTFVYFSDKDVVRHPLVTRIIRSYAEYYGI